MSDGAIFPPQDGVFFAILPLVHSLKYNDFFFNAAFSFQMGKVDVQLVGLKMRAVGRPKKMKVLKVGALSAILGSHH